MIGGESVPPAMCYYSKLEEAVENAVAVVEVAKGSDADSRPMQKTSCV
jgi:NADH-quinone oxidoreductase subunit G